MAGKDKAEKKPRPFHKNIFKYIPIMYNRRKTTGGIKNG